MGALIQIRRCVDAKERDGYGRTRADARGEPRRTDSTARGWSSWTCAPGAGCMLSIVLAHFFPQARVLMVRRRPGKSSSTTRSCPRWSTTASTCTRTRLERIVRDLVARRDARVHRGACISAATSRPSRAALSGRRSARAGSRARCLPRRRRCDAFGFHVRDQARRLKVDAAQAVVPASARAVALEGLRRARRGRRARGRRRLGAAQDISRGAVERGREQNGARRWKRSGGNRKRRRRSRKKPGIVAGVGAGKWRVLR